MLTLEQFVKHTNEVYERNKQERKSFLDFVSNGGLLFLEMN